MHVTFDHPDNYNSKSDKHIGDASEKHESFATLPHSGLVSSQSPKDKRNSQFFPPNSPPANFNNNVNHNNFSPSQPQHQPANSNNNFNSNNFDIPPHQHRFAASQQIPSQESLRNFHPSQPQPSFNQKQHAYHPNQHQAQPQSQQQQQLPFHHQQQQFRQQQQQQPTSNHHHNRTPQNAALTQQNFNTPNNHVKFPNTFPSNPYHHHQQQLPIKNAQNFHPQQNAAPQFNFNNQPPPHQAQYQNQQQQLPPFAQPPQQQFKIRTPQHQPPQAVNNNFINQQQHPPIPDKINHFQSGVKYQQPTTPPFNHHAHIPVVQKFNNNEHVPSNNGHVFQGGLVQQNAPNLVNSNKHEQHIAPQKNANSLIKQAFGGDIVQVQASETKFEHHVTEQLNAPVFIPSIDMDFTRTRPPGQQQQHHHHAQHQQQQQQQPIHHQQHQQQLSQQNHNNVQFADHSFHNAPERESLISPRQKSNDVADATHQAQTANFDISNFKIPHQTTARNYPIPSSTRAATPSPPATTKLTSTTSSPPRAPPAAIAQLPDEVPEDLRQVEMDIYCSTRREKSIEI